MIYGVAVQTQITAQWMVGVELNGAAGREPVSGQRHTKSDRVRGSSTGNATFGGCSRPTPPGGTCDRAAMSLR